MNTLIYYFIPEDGEKENMNIFIISKDYKDIKLKDIRENFPLKGEFYFRFKFEFQSKDVWIDFSNENANLPKYKGEIIMKVTRLNYNNYNDNNNN
jgi:hypothetical protein